MKVAQSTPATEETSPGANTRGWTEPAHAAPDAQAMRAATAANDKTERCMRLLPPGCRMRGKLVAGRRQRAQFVADGIRP